jgi:hypothetical protein
MPGAYEILLSTQLGIVMQAIKQSYQRMINTVPKAKELLAEAIANDKAAMKASTTDLSRVTPTGRAIGVILVGLAEPKIKQNLAQGIPDQRCETCAFRDGTVPNGCEQTTADALKCVKEGVNFGCHSTPGQLCYGFECADRERMKHVDIDWNFSVVADILRAKF